ncbi:MAG: hypothetical protein QNK24_11950 [Desulfuromusa sp.]|nr:hypothetical protein [Desulfuromusa sp.]
MSRQLFISLIVVALLSGQVWAAKVLSDPELATISGAGVEFSLDGQGLLQQPQQPNQQGQFPPAANPQNGDGMDLFPSTMVVLQSSGEIDHRRTLVLGDNAQQALSALSLDNGYASDAVATTNVFGGELDVPQGTVPRLTISQGSEVHQLYRQQGQIYSSEAGFRYEKTLQQRQSHELRESSVVSRVVQMDRLDTYLNTKSRWDVQVGKIERPGVERSMNSSLINRSSTPFIESFFIPSGVPLSWLNKFFGYSDYAGLTLPAPIASSPQLEVQGEDLLVKTNLELPSIDFGMVDLQGLLDSCWSPGDNNCSKNPVSLGTIGSTNLLTVLETIDQEVAPDDFISFSDDGIVLHGLGDLLADELNLNTGFVIAGSGHIKTEETAKVKIGAEANFGLETELTFKVDMSKIDSLGLIKLIKGANKWDFSSEDQLIDVTIKVPFIDLETPPFELEFDGLVVAQLGNGKVSADGLGSRTISHNFQDNSRVEESLTRDVGTSSFDDTVEHSVFVGGQMAEGNADLVAMSEGMMIVERGGNVDISGLAQRDMRVLHGVNAVTSIAANSLNVGSMPVFNGGITQMSSRQHNQFVQQR